MRYAIVIPTKNEEDNIEPLFIRIVKTGLPIKIIFIDDASTDRTGEIEERLKKRYPKQTDVLHRKESCGLGKALLAGYGYALEHTRSEFIGQMDGDGQHDPSYLKAMIKAAEGGAGVVLGSRYIESGSVGEWGLMRRLTSWGANMLVKRALHGSKVKDATTGYRVFSRQILQNIVDSGINSSGYVFQIDALAAAVRSGANVAEVPIEFKPRTSGRSKLKFRDKKEFLLFAVKNIF
jgi:dolichol-phosphate mannosyltransferase